MSQFRLYTDADGAFRWKLQASDKTTVARSAKGYKTEVECRASLAAVRKDAGSAAIDGKIRTVAASAKPRAAAAEAPRRTSTAK
jgi:uncharacterized protein YegP (UPF0339 family)